MQDSWLLPGARKDEQSITSDWEFTNQRLIEGVKVKEVKHVATGYGFLTEMFRGDWGLGATLVEQVFQATLAPGRISAWHAHEHTTDRLFVNRGLFKLVLYDARGGSSTFGCVNEFRFGSVRPALLVIPPKVWHGIQNVSSEDSSLVNLVDHAYLYRGPDHWRLPPNTPEIPYSFEPRV